MPIYEYRCEDCEQIFEEWQKGFEDKDVFCPVCGHKAKRIISNTAFVLKGTGWYVTDYCGGKHGSPSSGGNGGNGTNGTNGKSKPAESSDTASTAPKAESKPASTGTSAS